MSLIAVFANGAYYGAFAATTTKEAFEIVAAEIGGDVIDDFEYFAVTDAQAATIDEWWADGARAAEFPLKDASPLA